MKLLSENGSAIFTNQCDYWGIGAMAKGVMIENRISSCRINYLFSLISLRSY